MKKTLMENLIFFAVNIQLNDIAYHFQKTI